ncbi:PQQ-dependent sugar dehydrogenase [Limnoglobus roseus]|uniref:Putative L-sorbosone dehydrogenase, distantly related to a bacterial beta-galactosidase n=1 Tax=Limnoglobus roseus TaxID=2598579 RepID=A0A5C1ALN2_9BACT|nr:sorbosone dehydrogenase family protein [Limnoglobus roseus]QEL20121.1 putative L-sorbosone dehydrogenase, distantly related to a bacterial beta-galactosidase [Limnoglobus roseus]
MFSILLALPLLTAVPPLPPPNATPSVVKHPKVIGWPAGKTPTAPAGFEVSLFADELDSPRWFAVLPNGDVLVAEAKSIPKKEAKPEQEKGKKESKAVGPSANRITLLRDADHDGKPEVRTVFAENLEQPFGMCLVKETLFIANTNAVLAFAYKTGWTKLEGPGLKILDLPKGGYNNHWTRNLVANKDGTKLYVTVGSASNAGDHGTAEEVLRANILEMNLDGTGLRVFASGLRNPVGLGWEPTTGKLWTAVNERDELGDELVPDYLTSVTDGGFYGWPFSYFGQNEDPRRKGERPDLVKKALVPDYPLGSHTASLGLCFYTDKAFPAKYKGGAFVGQHGSWNRSKFVGYRVAFVPFQDGKPAAAEAEDFLTGFIANENEVYGRPVGVAVATDGSLLVADDASNKVWRVTATGK